MSEDTSPKDILSAALDECGLGDFFANTVSCS